MQISMMSLALVAGLSLGVAAGGAWAQVTTPATGAPATGTEVRPEVQRLAEALRMPEFAAVMRDEGLAHGATLETEMFPGRGGAGWSAAVARIHDPERMLAQFTARLDRDVAGRGDAVEGMLAFFSGPLGSRIVGLELEARRALADEATEEAARVTVEDMIEAQDPRMQALREFAETGDMVERNVAGALNANLAFYQGLAESGAQGMDVPEEKMLAEVWAQEPEVRAETERWLYSYMMLAYAPLSDADLAAYQAFSESEAGQAMNAALFAAFDEMFTAISRDLGRAAAVQMQGQDI